MRRMPIARFAAMFAATLAATVAAVASDPSTAGPFTPAVTTLALPVGGGATRATDVYYPASGAAVDPAAGRCPVVLFGHGFTRSKSRYADFGRHLASRGFVVLIADYRCGILSGCDAVANAAEMSALVDWIVDRDADPASIFFGHIAVEQIGTSGHSAGGLQAILAAALDRRVRAVAPMDPVDGSGLGAQALPTLDLPVAITHSERSSCNAFGSPEALYRAARAPKRRLLVVGATHCDPEQDAEAGCTIACGGWDAERHRRYLGAVTGWFELFLRCDPGAHEWAFGGAMAGAVAAGQVAYEADMAPPAPVGLVAGWDGTGVTISRQLARCGTTTGWEIERRDPVAGTGATVASGLDPALAAWRDGAVALGGRYTYAARDVFTDFAGDTAGAASGEAVVEVPVARLPRRRLPRPNLP